MSEALDVEISVEELLFQVESTCSICLQGETDESIIRQNLTDSLNHFLGNRLKDEDFRSKIHSCFKEHKNKKVRTFIQQWMATTSE